MDTKTESKVEVLTCTETTDSEIKMEAPLFILFAEYFGYVSMFNKVAEDWCVGTNVPELHVQKLIIVEAKSILRQMLKDYSVEDIRDIYEQYYPLVLEEYAESLAELTKNK